MTEGELLAMFLAEQLLRVSKGTPFAEDLQRAIQKLSEFLPDEVSIQWQSLDQMPAFRQSVVTAHDLDIFQILSSATLRHRQLKMTYWTASRDAVTEREIDPYHLICLDGGAWYVLGWCSLRKAVRMFAVSRIRKLKPTGKSF